MTLLSAAILLFLVIDPFGNAIFFLCVLKGIAPERQTKIIVRELLVALAVLIVFLLFGNHLLALLQISEPSLGIAGGIVLFLIAIRMIFGTLQKAFEGDPEGEPFIVPLAIPSVAGPSAIAAELLLIAREPSKYLIWLFALMIAWLASALILLPSIKFSRFLGERLLLALQRLMGLILTILAVQMLVNGIQVAFGISP
jgi:MarC family membrane protein